MVILNRMDVKPKDTTKPKIGRRKDLLLAANKNTGNISQKSNSPQIEESFKQKAHEYLRRGLSRAEFNRIGAMVDSSSFS